MIKEIKENKEIMKTKMGINGYKNLYVNNWYDKKFEYKFEKLNVYSPPVKPSISLPHKIIFRPVLPGNDWARIYSKLPIEIRDTKNQNGAILLQNWLHVPKTNDPIRWKAL